MSGEVFESQGIPALSTPLSGQVDAWVSDIIRKGTGFSDPAREMPADVYARVYRTVKEDVQFVLKVPDETIEKCRRLMA